MNRGRRLDDLGERRIVRELLGQRYAHVGHFGDDAAVVPLAERPGTLVVTTDPCPPPVAEILGARDPIYAGWLLATINLSDLAAAGAEPIALVTSLLFPADTLVADFERVLDGIDECCRQSGAHVVGGNLKEGPQRDLTATAVGFCPGRDPLRRSGGRIGDRVVILGELGQFWAGVLGVRRGLLSLSEDEELCRNILKPTAKTAVMARLAAHDLVTSAIDNSDGLPPSFTQLAHAAECSLALEGDAFEFSRAVAEMAEVLHVDPIRLAMGWGDWQVIATCAAGDVATVLEIAGEEGVTGCAVGELRPGAGVSITTDGQIGPLMQLESERFTRGSWFTSGLDGYVDALLELPLIDGG